MKVSIKIDDELYAQALELANPGMNEADILHEALKTFIRVQADKRLSELDGAAPDKASIQRRD